MLYRFLNYLFIIILLPITLLSCGGTGPIVFEQDGPPAEQVNVADIADAVPQATPRSKYGNPSSYVVFGKRYHVMPSSDGYKERGIASWYGSKFHGRRTSSGEPYDMHAMTAAHKTLPLPSYVKVTNLKNNRQVILKVNDRGPFHEGRIIDLSHTAAVKLGIKSTGTGWVEVEIINTNSNFNSDSSKLTYSPVASQPLAVPVTLQNKADLYLQVGAFVNSQNAHNLVNSLNTSLNSAIASYKVSIFDLLKNNQSFFRVRIGPIATVEEADKLAKLVVEHGFQEPKIIIE